MDSIRYSHVHVCACASVISEYDMRLTNFISYYIQFGFPVTIMHQYWYFPHVWPVGYPEIILRGCQHKIQVAVITIKRGKGDISHVSMRYGYIFHEPKASESKEKWYHTKHTYPVCREISL